MDKLKSLSRMTIANLMPRLCTFGLCAAHCPTVKNNEAKALASGKEGGVPVGCFCLMC